MAPPIGITGLCRM